MKRIHTLLLAACATLCATVAAQALTPNPADTTTLIRARELNRRKIELQQQIAAEDAKRNRQINGVAPETQERLNDRQDSVCLALRSQLTTVELELRELVPDSAAVALATQLNQLAQQNQQSRPTERQAEE